GVRLEVDHTLLGGADTIDDGALMSRDDVVGASLGVPGSPWRVGVGLVGRIDHRVGDAIEGDTGAVLSGGTEQIHRGRLGGRHDDGSTVFVGSGYASGRILRRYRSRLARDLIGSHRGHWSLGEGLSGIDPGILD